MAKLNFENKWVLVTGASSGLGKEIARYLAQKEKANLIISARRLDRLEKLKKDIEASCNSSVKVIQADLGNPEDVEKLFRHSTQSTDVFALVNNAGVTFYGKADSSNLERFDMITQVNFKTLVTLTLRFLEWFGKKGGGAILNVTSEAGFIPIPYQAVYAATKHAAQAFTEALIMENRKSPVRICSYAPGGIATEMLSYSGLDKKHSADSTVNMDAGKAAKLAVKAFKNSKFVVVPGLINKLTVFLVRFFPRKLVARATEIVYRLPSGK